MMTFQTFFSKGVSFSIYLMTCLMMMLITAAGNSNEEDLLLFSASPTAVIEKTHGFKNGNGYNFAVTLDGKYGLVSCLADGIGIVDLAESSYQIILTIPGYYVRQIDVNESHAFVVDAEVGLLIYDLRNLPISMKLVSTLPISDSVTALKLLKRSKTVLLLGNGIMYSVNVEDVENPVKISQSGTLHSLSYQIEVNQAETRAFGSQGLYGVGIYDISDLTSIKQLVLQTPAWIVSDCALHPDEDILYVVDTWYGLFSVNVSAYYQDLTPATSPAMTFALVQQYPSNVLLSAIISHNKKFLVISMKSVGLKFFDISTEEGNKLSPKISYTLNAGYFVNQAIFAPNDEYLYIVNGLQLLIHQRVTPNLSNDFPNVFNNFSSRLVFLGFEYFPYHIHVFKSGNMVAVNVGLIGTKLYDISDPNHPMFISMIASPQYISQDYVYAHPSDESILYVGNSQLGVFIYDISDPKNPVHLSSYTPVLGISNNSDGFAITADKKLAVIGNSEAGVNFADFSDPRNPKEISNWPSFYQTNIKKIRLSSSNKFVFCSSMEIGMIVVDISNQSAPQMVAYVNRPVGEDLILSHDEKFVFVACGFSGLVIIDISNPYKPFLVSSIAVDGWAMGMQPLFDEKYLLICQSEKGLVTILNIDDKENPYIFAKYENYGEHAYSIASTPNNRTALILGQKGLRVLPLKTDFSIHSEYQLLRVTEKGQSWISLDKSDRLPIGATVQITFAVIFSEREVVYQGAKYYKDFELKALPSYMSFVSSQKQLTMQVDKEGISSDNLGGENIIVLELLIQVTYKDVFAINPSVLSEQLSYGIVNCLIEANYLDTEQFLKASYEPSNTQAFYLDFYTILGIQKDPFVEYDPSIQMGIENLLMGSRVNYPIKFFVRPSLSLNKDIQRNSTRESAIINTSSSAVTVLFTLLPSNDGTITAMFVKKSLQGVLAVYSDYQNALKIEGSLSNVNLVMHKQILIANFTSLDSIEISYVISDGKNNDLNDSDTLDNLQFFDLNKPISLATSLQTQLNNQFADGNLFVAESFSFRFSSFTFLNSNSEITNELEYTAFIVSSNGELKEIISGESQTFFGTVQSTDIFSDYRIRVIATDGFSKSSDDFVMSFCLMPLSLVFTIAMKIIAPIIGVFSLWKYRVFLQRILMKRQYCYQPERAFVGKRFVKQIIIQTNLQKELSLIWVKIKQSNSGLEKEILSTYLSNQQSLLERIYLMVKGIVLEDQSTYPSIPESEFNSEDTRMKRIIQFYVLQLFMTKKENASTVSAFNKLRNNLQKKHEFQKDWYKELVKIHQILVYNQFNEIDQSAFLKDKDIIEQSILKDELLEDSCAQSQQCKEKQTNVGGLEKSKFIQKEPLEEAKKKKGKKYQDQVLLSPLQLSPFPTVECEREKVEKILKQLKCKDYDLHLLSELIKFEAIGLTESVPFKLNPARGETLHLVSTDLISINAYVQENEQCFYLKNILEIERRQIGLHRNSPLPGWLNVKITNNLIHLSGIPTIQDQINLQIRINDRFGFTVMQFTLEVLQEQSIDSGVNIVNSAADGSHLVEMDNYAEQIRIRIEENKDIHMSDSKLISPKGLNGSRGGNQGSFPAKIIGKVRSRIESVKSQDGFTNDSSIRSQQNYQQQQQMYAKELDLEKIQENQRNSEIEIVEVQSSYDGEFYPNQMSEDTINKGIPQFPGNRFLFPLSPLSQPASP